MKKTTPIKLLLIGALMFNRPSALVSGVSGKLEVLSGNPAMGAEGVPFSAMVGIPGATGAVTLNASNLPIGATFMDYGNATGLIRWDNPPFGSAGTYLMTVSASGAVSDTLQVKIIIEETRDTPVFNMPLPEPQLSPGQIYNVTLTAHDPEGDPVSFSLVDQTLYATGSINFVDNGNNSASLSFTPSTAKIHYLRVKIQDSFGHARVAAMSFRVGNPVDSIQNGNWSSGSTWSTGTPPDQNSLVTIHHNVTFNAQTEVVQVTVMDGGQFVVSRSQSTRLQLKGNLLGMPGSAIDIGSEASPIPANITSEIRFVVPDLILLRGAQVHLPSATLGMADWPAGDCGIVSMGLGSTFSIGGAPIQHPWVRLINNAVKNDDTLVVENVDISDWKVGAQILLTPLSDPTKKEFHTIKSISGNRIQLNGTVTHFHPGSRYGHDPLTGIIRLLGETEAPQAGETLVREQTEVALLSRNIKILSDLTMGSGVAHTMVTMGAKGSYHYGEFVDLGPLHRKEGVWTGLGRYSMHFHRLGDGNGGNNIRGNVVHNNGGEFNKGIVMHDSRGSAGTPIRIEDNIIVNTKGVGIYFEVATEENILVQKNLIVETTAPEPFPNARLADIFGYNVGFSVSLFGRTGSALIDNVVIPGPGTAAIAITPLDRPDGKATQLTLQGNQLRGGDDGLALFGKPLNVDSNGGEITLNRRIWTIASDQPNGLLNTVLFGNTGQDENTFNQANTSNRIENNTFLFYTDVPWVRINVGNPTQTDQNQVDISYAVLDGFFITNKTMAFLLQPGTNNLSVTDTSRAGQTISANWVVTCTAGDQTPEEVSPKIPPNDFGKFKNVVRPGEDLNITFNVDKPTSVRIEVRTTRGDLIKTLVDGSMAAGDHIAPWDMRNSEGHKIASGVYLLVMNVDGQTRIKKIVRVK